mgnify:FL=1
MKVIFLADIADAGKKFEVKDLKDGYVRNFLLPKKLVKIATAAALKQLIQEKAAWEKKEKELLSKLQAEAEKINGLALEFKLKTGEKGEIFSSVGETDILKSLLGKGFQTVKKVSLEKPIKTKGEHLVEVNLGKGIKAQLKIKIS